MKIKWIGHSCFLIEGDGVRIITDPYDERLPYRPPDFPADVVTVSHEHFDHNAVSRVKGNPEVVRGVGEHVARGIKFVGIKSYHDEEGGAKRGENTIFKFALEGITLAHFGDFGQRLTDEQAAALADVEAVFIPVGGYFTIGPDEALEVIHRLPNLRVVFPMHYKTDILGDDFPIAPVENFSRRVQNVRRIGSSEVSLTKESLPATQEVWILDYA